MMYKIWTIAKKELLQYFGSSMAYIVLLIMFALFNGFFFLIIEQNREASLVDMFQLMEFLFVMMMPLLTMRIFSEEKQMGTMELLLTAPIQPYHIVLGKFMATKILLTFILLLSLIYVVILALFSQPDYGAILSGYFGLYLEGLIFMSIGLMCSSWTKNQLVAAILSYGLISGLYFIHVAEDYIPTAFQSIVSSLGVFMRSENFDVGIIRIQDIVYFISLTLLFLVVTEIVLRRRHKY